MFWKLYLLNPSHNQRQLCGELFEYFILHINIYIYFVLFTNIYIYIFITDTEYYKINTNSIALAEELGHFPTKGIKNNVHQTSGCVHGVVLIDGQWPLELPATTAGHRVDLVSRHEEWRNKDSLGIWGNYWPWENHKQFQRNSSLKTLTYRYRNRNIVNKHLVTLSGFEPPAPTLGSYITLDKLLNLSVSQFLHQ